MADKRPARVRQTSKRATNDKQTIGKRPQSVKVAHGVKPTPERIAFAQRLYAGWEWCGMSWPEIGARMRTRRSPEGMPGESVGRLARTDAPIVNPPTWEVQRALERAMGLPEGYLNGDKPLPAGRRRTKPLHDAPERRQDANGVRARIEDQLGIFDRQRAGVEPAQVRVWLDELTRALVGEPGARPQVATAPAEEPGLPDGETKHLETLESDLVRNQRPRRTQKRSNGA